jgi:hypothetical protein
LQDAGNFKKVNIVIESIKLLYCYFSSDFRNAEENVIIKRERKRELADLDVHGRKILT